MSRLRDILGLLLPALICAGVEVDMKAQASVKGRDIRLSDVAVIRGVSPDLDSLKNLCVGKAAVPGYDVVISGERLRRVYLAPFYRKGEEITLSGAAETRVKTASRELTEASLREAVRSGVMAAMPWSKAQVQIDITSVPRSVLLADLDFTLRLEPAPACDWRGGESMLLLVEQGGETVKRLPVSLRIRVFGPVCVAASRLKRKAVLAETDVRVETRDITELDVNPVSDPGELLGRTLVRSVITGAILTTDLIEVPPLVKRGERVRITVREQGAVISVDGLAREDGLLGDKIHVRSALNDKLIEAVVTGLGEVQPATLYTGGPL